MRAMKKTMVLFIVGLFIGTSILPVISSEYIYKIDMNDRSFSNQSKYLQYDTPVWETGDTWKYTLDNIDINLENYQNSGNTIDIHLEIDELILQVIEENDYSYNLDFNAKLDGEILIETTTFEDFEFQIKFAELKPTQLFGDTIIRKSDLGIQELNVKLICIFKIKVTENPITPLIRFLGLRIPLEINLNFDFSEPINIIDFPLEVEKIWGIPSTNISIDGRVESKWLNFINFVNRIFKLFNFGFIPTEFEEFLPVIDISKVFEFMGYPNSFSINEIPGIFFCNETHELILPYGTVNAYFINNFMFKDMVKIYYAPEVANIAKVSVDAQSIFDFFDKPINISEINVELLETNYG